MRKPWIAGDGCQVMLFHQRRHPVREALLEGQGVEQAEDAAKRVVRRNTPRQGQEGLQPFELRFGVVRDLQPTIGPAQDATDGHEDDLVQLVNP